MSSRKELVGALRSLIRVIETADHLSDVRNGVVFARARALNEDAVRGMIAETPWTEFERVKPQPVRASQLAMLRHYDPTKTDEQLMTRLEEERERCQLWANSRYQVAVYEQDEMVHLSIKRIDNEPIHDWRDLQRIKDEIVGPENEALELYPARSRVVDTANQYHLWCLSEPGKMIPVGFSTGMRDQFQGGGAAQRPFEDDAP